MYARPSGYRYPNQPLRVPDNYGGNAFRESKESDEAEKQEIEASAEVISREEAPKGEQTEEASLLSKRGFGLRLGSLFGKGGSIGTEELLILALILLLADGSDGFDDLILFLVLLFFIK
jgi:hypothetical protein